MMAPADQPRSRWGTLPANSNVTGPRPHICDCARSLCILAASRLSPGEETGVDDGEQLIEIATAEGSIEGILADAPGAPGGVLMVGGAGGGMHGPAGIYPELAGLLQREGISALRLDYRHPNELEDCVYDTLAGVDALRQLGTQQVVLIGWSFGGAVVITAGAESDAVVGVATVASQTYGTSAISRLGERHLLLCHGTADATLPDRCSRDLYARACGPKELKLFANDNHGITNHRAELLDILNEWTERVLAAAGATATGGELTGAHT